VEHLKQHLHLALAGLITLAALAVVGYGLWRGVAETAPATSDLLTPAALDLLATPLPTPTPQPTAAPPETIIIYITGAVTRPDVYEVPKNARLKDAVLAAGGLTDEADSERINMAARIKDEQHIHIPRMGEAATTSPAAPGAQTAPGVAPADGRLNINQATRSELEELPGIGERLAERIVDTRTSNGPFTSLEQVAEIEGISEALIDSIRPLVVVE
jgi:competence protein ComEA